MRPILILPFLALPATAQDLPNAGAVTSAASEAATRVAEAAADRVLIADALGREVIGADGAAIGTVEDFVALPGGNLVAAVIAREGGGRIALPWEVVQVGLAAGMEITLPMTGAEIDGAEALRELSGALGL